jgi:cell division septation protein DedD
MEVQWSDEALAEQRRHRWPGGMVRARAVAVVSASLAFWTLQSWQSAVSQPVPPAGDQNARRAESVDPGGYYVQVSSQRIQADAQRSYAALQARFPSLLGGRPPLIKKIELLFGNQANRSVFYRVAVGPFVTAQDATQFCADLRTAGAPCVVSKPGFGNSRD